jgi:hypothetical protein
MNTVIDPDATGVAGRRDNAPTLSDLLAVT